MINALSAEQKSNLHPQRWIDKAFTKRDFNRPLIEESINWIYEYSGLPNPEIFYAVSPMDCQKVALKLKRARIKENMEWRIFSSHQIRYEIVYRYDKLSPIKIADKVKSFAWDQMKQPEAVSLHIEENLKAKMSDHRSQCSYYHVQSPDGIKAFQWCYYYEFLRTIKNVTCEEFDKYRAFIYSSGVFMSIYEESAVIVCPNPAVVKRNAEGKLHCKNGPALAWEDGYRLYYLNGIPVSEVFFTPSDKLHPLLILKEKNAEARKEIIRKLGIRRIIDSLGAKTVDKWNGYELLKLDIPGMNITPTYLKMSNPSVEAWHIEGVPPNITSCHAALAWRDGDEALYVRPETLT